MGLGAVLSLLIVYKLAVLRLHPTRVFLQPNVCPTGCAVDS